MSAILWTWDDSEQSRKQGWIVTHATTSDFDGFQIEIDDESAIFDCDFEAVAFVADKAMRGDPLATKAIEFIKTMGGRLWR